MRREPPEDATIEDFGRQWLRYQDNEGYYGSVELLRDILEPLLPLNELEGARVAEIGSGTGRIVGMLLDAGVSEVVALEPSEAFDVLVTNTAERAQSIRYVRARGEELPADPPVDLVLSVGVLHHIPEPGPVVQAAYEALEPGGKMLAWLYGREGNEAYLGLVQPLRWLTSRAPDAAVVALSHGLNAILDGYLLACRVEGLRLPLRDYARRYLARLSRDKRQLVVYDQLRPTCARYYRRREACALLEAAGFRDVRAHHRHGYSWTVIGTK